MLSEVVLVCTGCLVTGLLLLYAYVTKHYRRWQLAGVPHLPPSFPYGSHPELITQTKHLSEIVREDYERFKGEPVYGWHMYGKPVLGLTHLELVKRVLTTDFNIFIDRLSAGLIESGGNLDKHWLKQLTNLKGDEWRETRQTFSPVFTPAKVKVMMHFVRHVGERLSAAAAVSAALQEDLELKQLFEKFSLDSLACCAFGVDTDSFRTKDSRFMAYARQLFVRTRMDTIFLLLRLTPYVNQVLYHLKINSFKPTETKFFRDVVLSTIQQRRQTGERKNDMIDLMIDCIDRDLVVEDGGEDASPTREEEHSNRNDENGGQPQQQVEDVDRHTRNGGQHNEDGGQSVNGAGGQKNEAEVKKKRRIDEETVVSTAMVLLVAGFDTTSTTLANMVYELSKNPAVQERLQQEVDQACTSSPEGFPGYEDLQGMAYLDSVVHETIRLHPPAGTLLRICSADYDLPGTNIQLKKDDIVSISISGIHADSDYYPNPSVFNPDNFSPEARATRHPYSFLGFSEGPRVCIGRRFALLEIKVAMVALLRRFTFIYSERDPEVLTIDPSSHMAFYKGGLWTRVVERNSL